MLKVQTYDRELGWIHATRAGPEMYNALAILKGYNRDWPSERHRLVAVDEKGSITVIKE